MRYVLLVLYVIGGIYATPIRAEGAALSPRYVQVIGVKIATGYEFADSYECAELKNTTTFITRHVYKQKRPNGTRVVSALKDSPAEKAGLACGDVIVGVDDGSSKKMDVWPEDFKEIVNRAAVGARVTLTVLKAVPGDLDKDARTEMHLGTPVEMVLDTVTMDLVTELQKKFPLRHRTMVDDEYGPFLNFVSTSTFVEDAPGHIKYICSFAHRGEQLVMPVESPLLFMLGIPDVAVELKRFGEQSFTVEGDVASEGIPTLTHIPLFVAREIRSHIDMAAFFKKYGGHIGKVPGTKSPETNWYHWERAEAQCFLPEAMSRRIELKIERFQNAGIRMK